jgi:hypothetical protein
MNRNGGISISMIVIASIGVIVLSIVAALVIQAGGDFQEAKQCSAQGGTCRDTCLDGETSLTNLACDGEGLTCCRDLNPDDNS